jgi:2-amino-4-hydroxy-6-hydroxymethyldihydropteridine diphosphokinase
MRIGLGLGSNIGDRLHNLKQASLSINNLHLASSPLLTSPVYLTQPVDCKEDALPFYNMVIELESDLSGYDLLSRLREIEAELGRPAQRERNASRTIDLDILYADDLVLDSQDLTLPHPRLTQRRFVLQPLADIRPELILPGQSKNIARLLAELNSDEPALEPITDPTFTKIVSNAC